MVATSIQVAPWAVRPATQRPTSIVRRRALAPVVVNSFICRAARSSTESPGKDSGPLAVYCTAQAQPLGLLQVVLFPMHASPQGLPDRQYRQQTLGVCAATTAEASAVVSALVSIAQPAAVQLRLIFDPVAALVI